MLGLKFFRSFFATSSLVLAGFALAACNEDGAGQVQAGPAVTVLTTPSRVAITIDDLPYVMPSKTSPEEGLRYTTQIIAALQEHGIVATGFAVGQQINPQSIPALQAFADAGHTIGNHSWSHPDYGTLTRDEFHDETRWTDEILQQWIDGPRYYRFPFLREGETEAAKTAATRVLEELGYQNVPVTIDNDEWQFNADYLAALEDGDEAAAATIARNYVAHMQIRTAFFQSLAIDELGGDVDHVLLVHLNRINADHLGTLLEWYDAQGWTFISVDEAITHPVFSRPDPYAGPRGLSQIERVLGGKRD
ncbi:polysaccharide deacetylase family protein [uncultured Roseobacter sp.]|uniref:polysaccharide deacetylase family protein n=1 Tax=uncultured Roseobacter sp. TaxID=114847 RepID=UPI00262B2D3C|nr:polysaccharide deacetylase family protein [uncultured Roseobacter sp.]